VHDPADGTLLRTLRVHGAGSPWVLGLDVVGLGPDADGRVVVERWSLATGERAWSYRSEQPVALRGDTGWGSWRDETTIHLTAGAWSVALDLATGRETGATGETGETGATGTAGPAGGWDVELADGARARIRLNRDGTRESTVTGADGRVRFTAPGEVLVPVVDDGTAAGSVLLATWSRDDRVTAVDATTGRQLWAVPGVAGEVAVLSGSVLVSGGAGVVALDASTGEVRWDRARDWSTATAWGMVTDGRRVLTVEPAGQRVFLMARDVGSGAPVWRRPAPAAGDGAFTTLSQLPDGTVVLHDGRGELVALR
jgi:outer membrane protein assembly factor BamB